MFPQMLPILILSLRDAGQDEFMMGIFRQYHGLAFATAYQYLKEPNLADEAVGQCYARLIEHIDTLQELSEPQLKAYLFRTAKHCAMNLARTEAHQRGNAAPLDAALDVADERASLFMRVDERASVLTDALDRLSEPDREVIQLFYYDGYSQKEIAALLCIQPGSVASRLSRARNRLKQILIDMGMPNLL